MPLCQNGLVLTPADWMYCLLCVPAHVRCFFHFFHTAYLCLTINSNIWILLMIPMSVIMSLKYPGHLLNIHEVYWQVCSLNHLSASNGKMERDWLLLKFGLSYAIEQSPTLFLLFDANLCLLFLLFPFFFPLLFTYLYSIT